MSTATFKIEKDINFTIGKYKIHIAVDIRKGLDVCINIGLDDICFYAALGLCGVSLYGSIRRGKEWEK